MSSRPLAEMLRPKKLDEFVGQTHLVGKDKIITNLLKKASSDHTFPSLIFWGPPGTGKTTLARIIAKKLNRDFYEFSAVSASSKDIQNVIPAKTNNEKLFQSPIIFLDEIHRFNKAQQDKLLPFVEKGDIVLIGATTENPSFEINNALLSRTRICILKSLKEPELKKILKKALKTSGQKIEKQAERFLLQSSNGDARVLINTVEVAFQISALDQTISMKHIEQALQKRFLRFDKKGDQYYGLISAFIKSMRASDPDASIYYLARMIDASQDPLYIARRMVIFASEDIGVAQPTALVVANEVFRACETIGYPECAINLAHGAVYLAKAKKDRSAYNAYTSALEDVKKYGNLPVPLKILNAPTTMMRDLGHAKGYKPYTKESLLPKKLKYKKYLRKKNEQ